MKKKSVAIALVFGILLTTSISVTAHSLPAPAKSFSLSTILAQVSPKPGFTGPTYYFSTDEEAEAFYNAQSLQFRKRYEIIYW